MAKEFLRDRKAPPLAIGDTQDTTLKCLPWEIDIFVKMNNGRVLTLFDLGRTTIFQRHGLTKTMQENRMAGTIAGSGVRYRRRVRAIDRIEMRGRIVGRESRFTCAEQSIWRAGE